MAAQFAGLSGGIEPLGDRHVAGETEAARLDALHPPRGGQFFPPAGAVCAEQTPGDIERCRPLRQCHAKAGSIDNLQRVSIQQLIGVGTDLADQVERLSIGAEQDVLAIIQRAPGAGNCAGAATEHAAGFEQGYGMAGSRQFDSGSDAWSFQPALRLPLFDFGRAGANTDIAAARKVVAVAEYEKTIQQAFREVADLLSARDKLATQLAALEAAEKAQVERMRIADARYQAGISSYLEVLDAQRELFAAQQSVVATRRAGLTAAAQLYKALGGG